MMMSCIASQAIAKISLIPKIISQAFTTFHIASDKSLGDKPGNEASQGL